MLFVSDFAPAERKNFVISTDPAIVKPALKKQTQAEISIKEGGEWNGKVYKGGTFKNVDSVNPPPQYTDHSYWIRYEGPGIESDKVAYRIYLDWRNGFDIFGKRVSDVVLQNVGLDGYESYHHNEDWGVDVLKVGKSLGMGGFGFWNGKSVELVSQTDSRSATITNNGDIYSGFKINYNGWQVNNQKLDMTAHFAMNAGSRLVKVNLSKTERLPNMAIGLVKHPGTSLLQGNQDISGYAWTYVASWGKQSLSGENDHLGMAIIFRRDDRAQQTEDETSYVSVMKDKGGQLEYYFLAAWEHELDGVKTEAEFKAYLDREVLRLTKEPRVRFESTLSAEAKKKPLTADVALNWTKALADSELDRKTLNYHYQGWDENRRRPCVHHPSQDEAHVRLAPRPHRERSRVGGDLAAARDRRGRRGLEPHAAGRDRDGPRRAPAQAVAAREGPADEGAALARVVGDRPHRGVPDVHHGLGRHRADARDRHLPLLQPRGSGAGEAVCRLSDLPVAEEDGEGRMLARVVEGGVMPHLGGAVHDGIHALQGRDKLTRCEGGDRQAATRGAGDTLGKALCPGANARQVLGP